MSQTPPEQPPLNPAEYRFLNTHVRQRAMGAAPRIGAGRGGAGGQPPAETPEQRVRAQFARMTLEYERVLPQHTVTAPALKFAYAKAKTAVDNAQWDAAADEVTHMETVLRRPPLVRPQPQAGARPPVPTQGGVVRSQIDPVKVAQRSVRNHFKLLELRYQEVLEQAPAGTRGLTAAYQKARQAVEGAAWDEAAMANKDLEAGIRLTVRFETVAQEYRKVLPRHTITAGALTFHHDAAAQALTDGRWDGAASAITDLYAAVRIPPTRPEKPTPKETASQRAHREAYEKAHREIVAVDRLVAGAAEGSELARLAAKYKALPTPPDPAQVRDYVTALKDATPKQLMADELRAASQYDEAKPRALAQLNKARFNVVQPSGLASQATDMDAVKTLLQQAELAASEQRYDKAKKLIHEAREAAASINVPYDAMVFIRENSAVFERAAVALTNKDLWRTEQERAELKASYARKSSELDAARKTTDYPKWLAAAESKLNTAENILRAAHEAQADQWLKNVEGSRDLSATGGGLAGTLTTLQPFSQMKESDKLAAIAPNTGLPVGDLEQAMKKVYLTARVDGIALNLTPSQIAAAYGYSGSTYETVNGLLRGTTKPETMDPALLDRTKVQIELLCQALERLPDYDPTGYPLFRWETPWGDSLESRYSAGKEFQIKEFWSTGASGGSLVKDGDPPSAEIVIWGKPQSKGKDMSVLSVYGKSEGGRADGARLKGQGGGEVLFAPGTWFRTVTFKAFDADDHEVDAQTVKETFARKDRRVGKVVNFRYVVHVREIEKK